MHPLSLAQSSLLENIRWPDVEESKKLSTEGFFDVCIPLSVIFGFAEDYHKIVINAKHKLILSRSKSDVNAVIQTAGSAAEAAEEYKILIHKL